VEVVLSFDSESWAQRVLRALLRDDPAARVEALSALHSELIKVQTRRRRKPVPERKRGRPKKSWTIHALIAFLVALALRSGGLRPVDLLDLFGKSHVEGSYVALQRRRERGTTIITGVEQNDPLTTRELGILESLPESERRERLVEALKVTGADW